MIIEDQRIVAEDLRYRLTQLGYTTVAIAGSGPAALQSLEAAQPDIALVDISLPGGMDGIQAAEEILARVKMPIIYVTAHADKATLERAQRTRPAGYLIKPYEEQALEQVLEKALQKDSS